MGSAPQPARLLDAKTSRRAARHITALEGLYAGRMVLMILQDDYGTFICPNPGLRPEHVRAIGRINWDHAAMVLGEYHA